MLSQPLPVAPGDRTTVEPIIERGTGTLALGEGVPTRASMSTSEAGEVMLNVIDTDLREVVRLVLEDTLNLNYVIDPGIQGTVTVQTSQPVPADELLAVLDAVLRSNGADWSTPGLLPDRHDRPGAHQRDHAGHSPGA
jgi:general secretion pathway protein D